jgi:hypothetical protein
MDKKDKYIMNVEILKPCHWLAYWVSRNIDTSTKDKET